MSSINNNLKIPLIQKDDIDLLRLGIFNIFGESQM